MDGLPTKQQIEELFEVHEGTEARAARQFRADIFDPRRRWVKGDRDYRLSDRLWKGKADIRAQIDEVLKEAIRTGEDALLTAKKLEQFLDPAHAPIRTERGRLVRKQNRSIVTESPGRGGMGSFPARRLARTEITRVHGAATIWAAERTPFASGVKWNLSGRHPKPDICDENASRDSGLGAGVYPTKDVPRYPSHPHDLCNLSIATVEDVNAIVASLKSEYGLDEGGPAAAAEPGPANAAAAPFVPSTTVARAKAQAKELGMNVIGIGPDTLDAANIVNEAVAQLAQQGFSTKYKIHLVRAKDSKAIAQFNPKGSKPKLEVFTQGEFFKDPKGTAELLFEQKFLTSPDAAGVIRHEIGHAIHYQDNAYNLIGIPLNPTQQAIAMKVSRYAASSRPEFVAEVFAGRTGGRTYSDDVMELYREWKGPPL